MSYKIKALVTAATLTIASVTFAQTPAKPVRIRGEIASVAADSITVHRGSGDTVTIALASTTPISTLKKLMLSDIKPGSFVGTAAKTNTDGSMTAMEVVVFPEAARGTGEGHYAWDLGSNSTMTNANVDTVVKGTKGRTLQLSYKGGSNDITVPMTVPIVTFVPGTASDLVAGKKVFVVATAGSSAGQYTAQRITVQGKNGVAPPM
jgi:hypothetical protein